MKRLRRQLALFLMLLIPAPLFALSSDSSKPMEIVADSAEHDGKKKITIYRGNVEVIQGSMFISGHTLRVYYDDNQELDHAVMEGDRAYYKQLPDNSKVYDEAWAQQMEFYPNKNMVILIEDGKVVQKDVRFTGDRIEYDTANSRVIAKTVKQESGGADSKPDDNGRVRVIINPKKSDDE